MTEHSGLDEATAQRAALRTREAEKLLDWLLDVDDDRVSDAANEVAAEYYRQGTRWIAAEFKLANARAENATLREDQVSYEKDQEALTRALQDARAGWDKALDTVEGAMALTALVKGDYSRILRAMAKKVTEWRRYSVGRDEEYDRKNDLIHNIADHLDTFDVDVADRPVDDAVLEVLEALDNLRADHDNLRRQKQEEADRLREQRDRHSARVRAQDVELSTLRAGRATEARLIGPMTRRIGQLGITLRNLREAVERDDGVDMTPLWERAREVLADNSIVADAAVPAPSIPLDALRALAQGEPLDEVSGDYGVPLDVVEQVVPWVGRASGATRNETYTELLNAIHQAMGQRNLSFDDDSVEHIAEAAITVAEAHQKVECPDCVQWSWHGPDAERKVIEHWFRAHQPVDPDLARLRDELNEALGESHAARRDDTELVQTVRADRELVQQSIQRGFLSFDEYQPAPPSVSPVPEQGREEGCEALADALDGALVELKRLRFSVKAKHIPYPEELDEEIDRVQAVLLADPSHSPERAACECMGDCPTHAVMVCSDCMDGEPDIGMVGTAQEWPCEHAGSES